MTMKDNSIIEKTIDAAKIIGTEKAKALLSGINNDSFDEIDTAYPEILLDGSAPPSIEVVRELHQGYVDRIAAINLTNSLLLALGYDTPPNHAFKLEVMKEIAAGKGIVVTPEESWFKVEVSNDDFFYGFVDTDERLAYLRAIHFHITRHDPDMTEVINRQLAAKAGLTTPDYLENADVATQARAANTGAAE